MNKLKVILPFYDIQSNTEPETETTLPKSTIREMTWGRHGDNTTLQKTGDFNVTCTLPRRSSDLYPPVCRMMYRVHREVVEGEWVGDVWRDVAQGIVSVKEKTGWESQITYGACLLGLLDISDPRCDLAFQPGVYRMEVQAFRTDDPDFKEIPSSIFQWRIQESLPPPIVYINQESSIPHCEEWKINNFQYVCSKRITMTNLTILMNVEQDDTNMMYRTYFPGKQVNCIGGQPVPTPPTINQFGIGKLYNGMVDIDCLNSLVNCVDDGNTKISIVDEDGKPVPPTIRGENYGLSMHDIEIKRRLKMNRTALIQDMMESGVNIVMQEMQSTMASIDSTKNTIQMQHVHGLGKGSIVTTSSNTDTSGLLPNNKYVVLDVNERTGDVILGQTTDQSSNTDSTGNSGSTGNSDNTGSIDNSGSTGNSDISGSIGSGSGSYTFDGAEAVELTYRPKSIVECASIDIGSNTLTLDAIDQQGNALNYQIGDVVTTSSTTDILGLSPNTQYKISSLLNGNTVTLANKYIPNNKLTISSSTNITSITEWTIEIVSEPITESAGVTVTQGSKTGTLKTALVGATTSVVIETKPGVLFVNSEDVVIGSTTVAKENINIVSKKVPKTTTTLTRNEIGTEGTMTALAWKYPVTLIESTMVGSNELLDSLILDTVEGLAIGSIVLTNSKTDVSGIKKETKYYVKNIDVDTNTVTLSEKEDGSDTVDLSYQPPIVTTLLNSDASTNTLTVKGTPLSSSSSSVRLFFLLFVFTSQYNEME